MILLENIPNIFANLDFGGVKLNEDDLKKIIEIYK